MGTVNKMRFRLIAISCLLLVFLYGCQQSFEEVFVPTEIIPIEEMPEEAVSEMPVEEEVAPEEEVEEEVEIEDGLPVVEVLEGDLVKLNLQATDPDGDPLTYTFEPPLDENGEWQTEAGDAGSYQTTIVASDGTSESTQEIVIKVNSVNEPPVLEVVSEVTVTEGDLIELAPEVSDADGDEVTVSYSGFMTSSTYKTTSKDAGTHTVTVTASDGVTETTKDVTVVVEDMNRAPLIATVQDIAVMEGDLVVADVIAADPDKDDVTVSFTSPLDENGQWQTGEGDAGTYELTAIASDGQLTAETTFTVTVESTNRPPTITNVPTDVDYEETDTIEFNPVITDPEGEEVEVTYSGFMTSSSYTTTYNDGDDDPSVYTVTVTATDGTHTVSQNVNIRVYNKNRPPVFTIG